MKKSAKQSLINSKFRIHQWLVACSTTNIQSMHQEVKNVTAQRSNQNHFNCYMNREWYAHQQQLFIYVSNYYALV